VNDAEQTIEAESARAIIHELRNISFGLLMTVDEVAATTSPDPESVRHLRRLASRLREMADIVHQLSSATVVTKETFPVDLVLDAVGERFPETSLVRIGPRGAFARGDAQLFLHALAQLVAAQTVEGVDVTIAVALDADHVHVEIASSRPQASHPALSVQLAKRLLALQGGRLEARTDRPAFVATVPRAQEGVP
jgi:hypothetical protein